MTNYKDDNAIQKRVAQHLSIFREKHPDVDWFVIAAQGSMNYKLFDENSDVDTKILTLPSLEEIVLDKKPLNYTLVIDDGTNEHCDVKDVRMYFKTFRKQNINFVEILYTPYWIVNPKYKDIWFEMLAVREELVHMNRYAAVSCIKGMAQEKFHALCHKYPSKVEVIEKFGYDPKQLHHLVRLSYFFRHYINNEPYEDCLIFPPGARTHLIELKRDGCGYTKEEAVEYAETILDWLSIAADQVRGKAPKQLDVENFEVYKNVEDAEMSKFLDDTLYKLISRSLKEALKEA